MKRFLPLLLCFLLLCPAAQGLEDTKYIALTIDDSPTGADTGEFLAELRKRGARVTFLLRGERVAAFPEQVQEMMDGGHEIGLQGYGKEDMASLSRRQIAKALADTRALLPEGCEVRFFRPLGSCCTDGIRQVAQVTRLSLLGWSVDPRQWPLEGRGIVGTVRDGDIIVLPGMNPGTLDAALSLIDQLQRQGYQFITVSQLAKERRVKLKPGELYTSFPPEM